MPVSALSPPAKVSPQGDPCEILRIFGTARAARCLFIRQFIPRIRVGDTFHATILAADERVFEIHITAFDHEFTSLDDTARDFPVRGFKQTGKRRTRDAHAFRRRLVIESFMIRQSDRFRLIHRHPHGIELPARDADRFEMQETGRSENTSGNAGSGHVVTILHDCS
jgi:hypothetical protein